MMSKIISIFEETQLKGVSKIHQQWQQIMPQNDSEPPLLYCIKDLYLLNL